MEALKLLYEYFPVAVYTGTEHKQADFSGTGGKLPLIRVRIFQKAINGEFVPGHFEDFELDSLSELATQIERYIQFAVGKNIRENA